MTFGSLFSGIGCFDLGLERAGMKCLWQVERDKDALSVLARHWPDVPRFTDVTKVGGEELAGVDGIVFGWPCQDLSVAGRRAGMAGERSGLFFEAARIIGELKPKWFIAENVPGLLSSGERRDMGAVVWTLEQLGYCVSWRVLDAQYFGVAQRRRRVFFVGSLGDASSVQILFESESLSGHPAPSRTQRQDVAGSLGGGSGERGWCDDTDRMTFLPVPALTGNPYGDHEAREGLLITGAVSSGEGHDASEDGTGRGTPLVFHENRSASLSEQEGGVAALRAGASHSYQFLNNAVGVRRLTPRECERLQGLPDDHTRYRADGVEIKDSPRYQMVGNGGCVNVLEWIGRRIMRREGL